MNIIQITCGDCAGAGKRCNWKINKNYNWKAVYMDDVSNAVEKEEAECEAWKDKGYITMNREENECEACNGKGYIEYAAFTLEEAKAILKHCGLNTES